MTEIPKVSAENVSESIEVRQFKPGEKLKKQIEQHVKESIGVDGELVELIEIPSEEYAKQIMVASELATSRFLKDGNTIKTKVSERTPNGSTVTEYSPVSITQMGIAMSDDKARVREHIAIQRLRIAQPHEFRMARKFILEQVNQILSVFGKPTLELKDPGELQQQK